jgi:phosphatidylglycerophosphate synthase
VTMAEFRAVVQPPGLLDRNSGEHWAGRLYVRRFSPYLTRALSDTPVTPNGVTCAMIAVGLLAAAALTLGGLGGAIVAVVLIQCQILFDCSDGELARWRRQKSITGVYLDRIGHYLTEAALPVGLGIRADGGWDAMGTYTTLGLVVAVLVLLVKSETALVHVARAEAGLPPVRDSESVAAPRGSLLRRLRRGLSRTPFFRAFVAMEFTLLALAAAVADAIAGGLSVTRGLVWALVPIAAITAAGHLLAILTSDRLR